MNIAKREGRAGLDSNKILTGLPLWSLCYFQAGHPLRDAYPGVVIDIAVARKFPSTAA